MIHFIFSNKAKQYLFLKVDNEDDLKIIDKVKEKMNLIDPVCYLKSYTGLKFTQDFL